MALSHFSTAKLKLINVRKSLETHMHDAIQIKRTIKLFLALRVICVYVSK